MFRIVIPARFGASRLPGKPLIDIAGKPLIEWVWREAQQSGAQSTIIATDDERIRAVAAGFGADVLMTSPAHASGTDRMAEVVERQRYADEEIVVNLQGDEPMLPAGLIGQVAGALREVPAADLATAAAPVASLAEFLDPNAVKALIAPDGRALYFSRAPVPWPRERVGGGKPTSFDGALRHIGLYAYRVGSLKRFAACAPTPLEVCEKLEQLRALEHGMRIQVVVLNAVPPAGVDTADDLERVRALLGSR